MTISELVAESQEHVLEALDLLNDAHERWRWELATTEDLVDAVAKATGLLRLALLFTITTRGQQP